MKQNLFKAVCPVCEKKAKSIMDWVKIVNKDALPSGLAEEKCPECVLDEINKIRLGTPLVVL